MNEVDAIIEVPVLMLRCPKCKWRFPAKLPAFCKATKEDGYLSCAACGCDFHVNIELLGRDAQLRNEVEKAGADVFRAQVFCIGCGTLRNVIDNIVEPCPHCGNARKRIEAKWLPA